MTIEEFGRTIKSKYPQYGDMSDAELGTRMLARYPQYQDMVTGVPQPTTSKKNALETATKIVTSIFPGKEIGSAVAKSLTGLGQIAKGDWQGVRQTSQDISNNAGRLVGDVVQSVVLPASLALNPAKTFLGSAAQFGGLGAASAAGNSLAQGGSVMNAGQSALIGGGVGAATGGTFNLLGKALNVSAPPIMSFTSGVPSTAIKQAASNPQVARQGVKKSVEVIRADAVKSLSSLYKELGNEFGDSLKQIKSQTGQTKRGVVYNQSGFIRGSQDISQKLNTTAQAFAREFRLSIKNTPLGAMVNFDKSPIVKAGERATVQETLRTLSVWDDFSARGMQDLAERIGALRNFESGARTESSAIVGKIYNQIAQKLIPEVFPELAKVRTFYSSNKKTLDEIAKVLSASKKDPVSIQQSITRLSNIFRTDRDTYLNLIKLLAERSGVDYLSLLAGTEFQKVLPSFMRGIGGAGVAAISGQIANPYLWLLAPLFSPRAVGALTLRAVEQADSVSNIARATATQLIGQTTSQK